MANHTWTIDRSHSSINFSVRHMVVSKTRGQFNDWEAQLSLDEDDLSRSHVDVTIAAKSINTGVADRDNHLRSPDFFDVEQFPELRFRSTRVERGGDGYRIHGELTIKDVTREVTLEVEDHGRAGDPSGNSRAGFTARVTISRKDFGLTWNQVLEAGGLMVGDRVTIELEIEAMAKLSTKAA